MSLFTDLVKTALGGESAPTQTQTQTQTQDLLQGLLGMLDKAGGVQGLADKFQQSGLGDLASSWIGTGQNKPITADQLASVLGREQIESLSQQAHIPAEKGADVLAEVLPALVDKLTPDGQVPEKSHLMTLGKVILGGLGVAAAAKVAASVFGKKDEEPAAADFSDVQAGGSSAVAQGATGLPTAGTYTVVSGDTLSKIAKRAYGDANAWPRIFDANRDKLDDPNRIFPGQVLRIP